MAETNGRMARRVLVSALSLLFGTAAHAGFYPGLVDPGGNNDDIPGFTANFVVDVPDTCIHFEDSGWESAGSGGCGNASLVSGTVYLYSTSPAPPTPGTFVDSFTLNSWPLLGVYSVNGALEGIDTDPMGEYHGSSVYLHDTFWLQFVSGFASVDPAYLSVNSIDNVGPPGTVIFGPVCRTDPNGAPVDCVVTVTVPEPGTLALLFSALGGGWLAKRRKRNAAA